MAGCSGGGHATLDRFSPRRLATLEETLSPGERLLAGRWLQGPGRDLVDRPPGWSALDIETPPTLGLGVLDQAEARRMNSLLPITASPSGAAQPFYLTATGPERERALLCLTQAIYYEAALEPDAGQAAVAQTVLNRVRHPAFPHTICGVVYQGSQVAPGCQFSFTCDGSRDRTPVPWLWRRARAVAERAVSGYVMSAIGSATAYHADYVFPSWGPTLVKIGQIGAHIF
jgi:spore germination cell wall hydrolase CwlJ-like protein